MPATRNPYSLRATKKPASTAKEYRKKMAETFTMQGPSTLVYEVRRPEPSVMRMMLLHATEADRLPDDKERLIMMEEIAEKYLPAIITSPKVAVFEPDEKPSNHVLNISEIDYADKLALIAWALGTETPDSEETKLDENFLEDDSRTATGQSS